MELTLGDEGLVHITINKRRSKEIIKGMGDRKEKRANVKREGK